MERGLHELINSPLIGFLGAGIMSPLNRRAISLAIIQRNDDRSSGLPLLQAA